MQGFTEILVELDRSLGGAPATNAAAAPSEADLRLQRGRAALQLKLFDIAIFHFSKLIVLQPENAEAWAGLGQAQLELGRSDEALASLDTALKHRPDDPAAWTGLGIGTVMAWHPSTWP